MSKPIDPRKSEAAKKRATQYKRSTDGRFIKSPLPANSHAEYRQMFAGIPNMLSGVYRNPDEAYRNFPENSKRCLNDLVVLACLNERKLSCASLRWRICGDEMQAYLIEQIIRETPHLMELFLVLLDGIWYGRAGALIDYDWRFMPQQMMVPAGWQPIHGDTLVFTDDQVGYKVGPMATGDTWDNRPVVVTPEGRAVLWNDIERDAVIAHSYQRQAGDYDDLWSAGLAFGSGLRQRVYWAWEAKQELLREFHSAAQLFGAGGLMRAYFDLSNPASFEAVKDSMTRQQGNHLLFFPRSAGEQPAEGLDIIPPQGIGLGDIREQVKYYDEAIRRAICGITNSNNELGMGGDTTELYKDAMACKLRYDALALAETLTRDFVRPLCRWNGIVAPLRFEFIIPGEGPEDDTIPSGLGDGPSEGPPPEPEPFKRRYAKGSKGKWITLNAGDGGGTPVQVDGKGNILKGPSSLKGKGLHDLKGGKPKGTSKHRPDPRQKPLFDKHADEPAGEAPDLDLQSAYSPHADYMPSSASAPDLGSDTVKPIKPAKPAKKKPKKKKGNPDNLWPYASLDRSPPPPTKGPKPAGDWVIHGGQPTGHAPAPTKRPSTRDALESIARQDAGEFYDKISPDDELHKQLAAIGKDALAAKDKTSRKGVLARLKDWWKGLGKSKRAAFRRAHPDLWKYEKGKSKGKWITLKGGSGEDGHGGTPVQVDDDGNILKGPKGLADKGIKNLGDFKGHGASQKEFWETDSAREARKRPKVQGSLLDQKPEGKAILSPKGFDQHGGPLPAKAKGPGSEGKAILAPKGFDQHGGPIKPKAKAEGSSLAVAHKDAAPAGMGSPEWNAAHNEYLAAKNQANWRLLAHDHGNGTHGLYDTDPHGKRHLVSTHKTADEAQQALAERHQQITGDSRKKLEAVEAKAASQTAQDAPGSEAKPKATPKAKGKPKAPAAPLGDFPEEAKWKPIEPKPAGTIEEDHTDPESPLYIVHKGEGKEPHVTDHKGEAQRVAAKHAPKETTEAKRNRLAKEIDKVAKPYGEAPIEQWSKEDQQRHHELKQQLPSYGEEAAAAKERLAAKTEAKKAAKPEAKPAAKAEAKGQTPGSEPKPEAKAKQEGLFQDMPIHEKTKPQQFDTDPTKQGVLFSGLSALPGQQDLFQTDGPPEKPEAKPKAEGEKGKGIPGRTHAPAGGAVSEVDGEFYKGGHLMPVHGLSEKREKGNSKGQPETPAKPNENAKDKPKREPRPPRSKEEAEAEKKAQEDWNHAKFGPVGEAMRLGDRPHGIKGHLGSGKPWLGIADKLDNDHLQHIADKAKEIAVSQAGIRDEADAKNYHETQEGFKDVNKGYINQKHLKAKPASNDAHFWINEAISSSKNKPETIRKLNDLVRNPPQKEAPKQPAPKVSTVEPSLTKLGHAIDQAAKEHKIHPKDLRDAVNQVWSTHKESVDRREAAKAAARKATGLHAGITGKLSNSGLDHGSTADQIAKAGHLPGLNADSIAKRVEGANVYASELAGEYPDIFGNPDSDEDVTGNIFRVLNEGKQTHLPRHHPDILNQAIDLVRRSGGGSRKYVDLSQVPFKRRKEGN